MQKQPVTVVPSKKSIFWNAVALKCSFRYSTNSWQFRPFVPFTERVPKNRVSMQVEYAQLSEEEGDINSGHLIESGQRNAIGLENSCDEFTMKHFYTD